MNSKFYQCLSIGLTMLLFTKMGHTQAPLYNPESLLRTYCIDRDFEPSVLNELQLMGAGQSSLSEFSHYYYQQWINGIPLENAFGSLHLNKEKTKFHVQQNFISSLAGRYVETIPSDHPNLSTSQIKQIAAKEMCLSLADIQTFLPDQSGDSLHLVYLQKGDSLLLSRKFILQTKDDLSWVLFFNLQGEKLIKKHSRTFTCTFEHDHSSDRLLNEQPAVSTIPEEAPPIQEDGSGNSARYFVFPPPLDSPLSGGRSFVQEASISDPVASPLGWHTVPATPLNTEFYHTQGNNVYAYYDPFGLANEPAPSPIQRLWGIYLSGNVPIPNNQSRDFNYQNDINSFISSKYIEDAITNAFVWCNYAHDVFYQYGFDEEAGNFQARNLSGQGEDDDFVLVECQNGSGLNNARFNAQPDGEKPTMRLFLWNNGLTSPNRDVSFENQIVIHEYAHGLTSRLIGGPDNVDCFSNFEQGSEGWSDFFGLMLTMADKNGNSSIDKNFLGEGIRSMGNYVMNEDASGNGLRPAPYVYNMDSEAGTYNDFTYADIEHLPAPHGTGFLWASMLWDMTLNLIDRYGYEADLMNASSNAGNIRAMKIVIEALKITPCEPRFFEMRDAVLLANDMLFNGEGEDLLWDAFARRGLGYGANAKGEVAFDNPTLKVEKTVDKQEVAPGEALTYTIKVTNNAPEPLRMVEITDYVPANFQVTHISNGGQLQNGVVSFPPIGHLNQGTTVTRTITGVPDNAAPSLTVYENAVESPLPSDFVPALSWLVDSGNPNPNSGSTQSWWHFDPGIVFDASLMLNLNLDPNHNNHLSFWQYFDLEPTFDGGVIEIYQNGEWTDLGPNIIQNGYTGFIYDVFVTPVSIPIPTSTLSGRRAFTGTSPGYINTIVDLSDFEGEVWLRFRIAANDNNDHDVNCDEGAQGCYGWNLDDFKLIDFSHIKNTVCVETQNGYSECADVGRVGTVIRENQQLLSIQSFDFAVEAKKGEDLQVFPNPTSGQFTLHGSEDMENVSLFDHTGRFIQYFDLKAGDNKHEFDISHLPKGFYYVKASLKGEWQSVKIIVH